MSNGYTNLEKRIFKLAELGKEWADLHEAWMELDENKKSVLASLQNDFAQVDRDAGEAKLERLARASEPWGLFIKRLVLAKGAELRAKVRYEAAQAFYEAGRTRAADERAMKSQGIGE